MIIKFDGEERKVKITKREIEVLYHLSNGAPTEVVAEKLHLSKHTIISHRRKLMDKLKAKNTAHLIRKGFEFDLLHSEVRDSTHFSIVEKPREIKPAYVSMGRNSW